MDDIIKHLRYHSSRHDPMDPIALIMREAADELEFLRNEIDHLVGRLEQLREEVERLNGRHLFAAIAAIIIVVFSPQAKAAEECLPSLHAARKAHPTEHISWRHNCYFVSAPNHHKHHPKPHPPKTAPAPQQRFATQAVEADEVVRPPATVPDTTPLDAIHPVVVRTLKVKPISRSSVAVPPPPPSALENLAMVPPASPIDRNALADALDRRATMLRLERRIQELESEIEQLKRRAP